MIGGDMMSGLTFQYLPMEDEFIVRINVIGIKVSRRELYDKLKQAEVGIMQTEQTKCVSSELQKTVDELRTYQLKHTWSPSKQQSGGE
jgi:hypothetical protein